MNELLLNSHLRVLDVNGTEIHLESMIFRAIKFDQLGAIWMSLVAIRLGTYPFIICRNPRVQGLPQGTVGIQEPEFRAGGRFIVELTSWIWYKFSMQSTLRSKVAPTP
ncbi:MAG: hypothetical protein OXE78_00365 [Gammaproteobacteria bacterium]|nr:hypothetical protein [Gammaproteobacteria bacterium]